MVPRQYRSIMESTHPGQRAAAPFAPLFPRAIQVTGRALVTGVPLLILLLLVVYPLAAIILQSIFPNIYAARPNLLPSLNVLRQVMQNSQSYLALFNSLWLSAITALIASVIGLVLAILVKRTDLPLRRIMDMLVWITFFTPSFLIGEAWSLFMIRGGIPDQYLHFPDSLITWFFSPVGVILVLSLKTFPYGYLSVAAALRWLGSEFEDAACLAGARLWQAWLSINIPLVLPAIFAGGLIAFAEALSDFGMAATLAQNASVTLITYQIYTAIATFPVNFGLAAALSLLLVAAITLALLAQALVLRTRSFQVISGKNRPARPIALGNWKIPALLLCLLLFLPALLIPLLSCLVLSFLHAFGQGLTASNWTLDNYIAALSLGSDALAALFRTLWLALGTATITVLVGLPLAFLIQRTKLPGRRLLSLFTLITIAVPGIILACGYIFAWNAPYLEPLGIGGPQGVQLYGTIWLLFAAFIGGSLPYATRFGIGALEQVGQNLLEAGRVQGAGILQLLRWIVAPLVRGSLVSIWLLVFTGTMFELAASELLYPPGQPTMPVQIIRFFANFQPGPGTALAMLNIGLVALTVILLRGVPRFAGYLLHAARRRKRANVPAH